MDQEYEKKIRERINHKNNVTFQNVINLQIWVDVL